MYVERLPPSELATIVPKTGLRLLGIINRFKTPFLCGLNYFFVRDGSENVHPPAEMVSGA